MDRTILGAEFTACEQFLCALAPEQFWQSHRRISPFLANRRKSNARGKSRSEDRDPFAFVLSHKRHTAIGESPTHSERQVVSLLEQRPMLPAETEQPLRQE